MKNLGKAITEIQQTYQDEDRDLEMDGSGECGRIIHQAYDRRRDAIATNHGFADADELWNEAETRTSLKAVYRMRDV